MALLAALAGTASAAPYVLPSPQPGALTPNDWQPVYAIEAIYSINDGPNSFMDVPDTWGVRGSFNLYSDASESIRHQFSLNAAPQWGTEKEHDRIIPGLNEKLDVFLVPVTLGYDLNIGITDSVFLDLGAKAGYNFAHVDYKVSGEGLSESDSSYIHGFTYSVGAGLKVQCSDAIYVRAGYEFGRTFFDTHDSKLNVNHHIISVGVGCQF